MRTRQHAYTFAILGALSLVTTWSAPALGFGRALQIGADVGYSATHRDGEVEPPLYDGAAFGLRLAWQLNGSFGLEVEGLFDWHPDTRTVERGVVEESDGSVSKAWVEGPPMRDIFTYGGALSLNYAVDVMRGVPFLSVGLVGLRFDQTAGSARETLYEAGVRITLGFDYRLTDWLDLGAAFISDQLLLGDDGYTNRMALVARVSFVWEANKSEILEEPAPSQ